MNIVIFTHPAFMQSLSMPRFAAMLERSFEARGHRVTIWQPRDVIHRRAAGRLRKWAGYVDQYLLFPRWVRRQLRQQPADTLYVFSDQAQGPWVPLVKHLPHAIHVHDLLALRGALGDLPEHPVSFTGRIYQRYIRWGFRQGRHFISISGKSRDDLHRFGGVEAVSSTVVHNGLNFPFAPMARRDAMDALASAGWSAPPQGMVVHVSGNTWYKNVRGVIAIYAEYARSCASPLPLWLVGQMQPDDLSQALATVPPQGHVLFVKGLDNAGLQAVYSVAFALLFPSLEEGFGWPLIEAQACGCPCITTDAPPMNEVAGPAARLVPRLKHTDDLRVWAKTGAQCLAELHGLDDLARANLAAQCIDWAARFTADRAIQGYLAAYEEIMESESKAGLAAKLPA